MNSQQESSRKDQIIATALEMMRKLGYQGTSMREIASALQIEAASLYNHIDSKEEILKETCFIMAARFNSAMAEVNDIYFNAAEKLAMAVKNHVRILTSNPNAGWVFIHEWRFLSEPHRKEFIKLRDKYENEFIEILRNGETEGLFNEVDHKFAVLTILSSLNWIVEWYRPDGEMNPEEIADRLTGFIMSGLRKDLKI